MTNRARAIMLALAVTWLTAFVVLFVRVCKDLGAVVRSI